jgi:hypothetical protein
MSLSSRGSFEVILSANSLDSDIRDSLAVLDETGALSRLLVYNTSCGRVGRVQPSGDCHVRLRL